MTEERRHLDRRQGERRLPSSNQNTRLGDLLQRWQFVSSNQLDSALGEQHSTDLRLGEQLVSTHHIERGLLDMVLHEQEMLRKLRVIVKSGVWALELGGGLANCFHLDSISEFHTGNHLCQIVEAA